MAKKQAKPTYEELQARIAELENAQPAIDFKIGNKGGVSVYGLGRFPVTLYYEQWTALLANADALKKFMEDNKRSLKLRNGGGR